MKQERSYPVIRVSRKQTQRCQDGHPWIYADEITDQPEQVENGSLVDVHGVRDQYLGTGLWSKTSQIRVRLLSRNANETFDEAFFRRRVRYAIRYRQSVMAEDWQNCRLIHGEADGLPGVTVDRYGSVLVSEILSCGMEQRKQLLYRLLAEELAAAGVSLEGIYERSEGPLRQKEGLSDCVGWAATGKPAADPVRQILENGLLYEVDVANGQKTGFFLDQKYNRLAVRRLARGRRVLDICTHTGAFALNAARGQALSVTGVDISGEALQTAAVNARLNDLSVQWVQADMFAYLEEQKKAARKPDFIILDPPAFTRSRKTVAHAHSGYQRLNRLAMQVLPRGGWLVTCSCSHFMSRSEFQKMLHEAALEAGVSFRIVEARQAAPDHPVLDGVPETAYLKCFILQIV